MTLSCLHSSAVKGFDVTYRNSGREVINFLIFNSGRSTEKTAILGMVRLVVGDGVESDRFTGEMTTGG